MVFRRENVSGGIKGANGLPDGSRTLRPRTTRDRRTEGGKNGGGGIETARLEGAGIDLATKGAQGENRHSEAVAKGNHDDVEMDSPTPANGKLDVCLQSPGIPKIAKEKMKSVKSEDRPL